jgi:hypothetical protein
MIDRQTKKPGRSGERGAALVVAIAIMTILLALALTFYAISRNEVNIADNIQHQVQNDLNLDGVLAKVQSDLNRNFLKYPNATSYDQAPFTTYDGSWVVGKEWALRNGIPLQGIDTDGDLLPDVPGVPLVNLRDMPDIEYPNGVQERMFSGVGSRDWLMVPRYEVSLDPMPYAPITYAGGGAYPVAPFDITDRFRAPFVTPAFYGPSETRNQLAGLDPRLEGEVERYPLEWIDTWTDVDNDGDGLKDAIWIPIAQERLFSGGDIVDEATGRRMYADDIDNDLDGLIDENQEDNLDYDGDGNPGGIDPDEQLEIGSFVYFGGADGLDNDGDGAVDEGDEAKLFLAASLPELIIPLDFNADGKVPDFVPNAAGDLVMIRVELPATISVQTNSGIVALTATDVDAIDNNYDMLIDNYHVYAYVGPNTETGQFPPFRLRGFEDSGVPNAAAPNTNLLRVEYNDAASNSSLPVGDTYYSAAWRHQGNWAANDSQLFTTALLKAYDDINLDVAIIPNGGLAIDPVTATYSTDSGVVSTFDYTDLIPYIRITHSGEPVSDLVGRAAITVRDEASRLNVNVAGGHKYNYDPNPPSDGIGRSLGQGATTAELETRNLPDIDPPLARNISFLRTGTPKGTATPGYEMDTQLPGYGRVDDNANALVYAFNGKDDDGDGLIDEGLYLPDPDDASFPAYFAQLGLFEGVDEPGELQRFNPLPNLLAEGANPYNFSLPVDTADNDADDATNERGELGDLQLQDTLQLIDVNGIGPVTSGSLQQLTTAFSTDRNTNFVSGREGVRALNKLDYNFATPVQIAANLLLSNPFESVTARPLITDLLDSLHLETNRFAEGLRQGDVHIRASATGLMWGNDDAGSFAPTILYFPADPVLQAMQAAVDIVDNRDRDHVRSVLTSEKTRVTPSSVGGYDYFPTSLSMRERIEDGALMPLGELQDHLRDQMGLTRRLEVRDDWWTFEARPLPATGGVVGATGAPEVREISYTASGNEAIRINEIMVRAVRRVEAEAVPDDGLLIAPSSDPMRLVATPNFFDPTPEGDKLPAPAGPAQPTTLPDFTVVRQTLANSNWGQLGNPYIGEGSFLQTSGTDINPDPANGFEPVEDVLQFSIFPTNPFDAGTPPVAANLRPLPVGLPSGRYYLTVKATINGLPIQGDELQYSIRYVDYSVPTPTILDDVLAASGTGTATSTHFPARWTSVPAAHVANGIGAPLGWAFINGTPAANGLFLGADSNYFLDGGFDHDAPESGNSATFTVSVPEYTATDLDGDGIQESLVDTNGDGLPDKALCIAFRLNPTLPDATLLQIDALDFSQEPDHEWVELVNASDEEVNIGDWVLEVGIPDKPSVPRDPFKSRWKVPPNTTVAPKGMVLLSFNKYDHYQALNGVSFQNPVADRVSDNGIGLASGGFLPHTEFLTNTQVTVPDIKDLSWVSASTPASLLDPTGSVFERYVDSAGRFQDYVDRDGDGRSSMNTVPAIDVRADQAALEGVVRSTREQGSDLTAAIPNLPWDRIVQLDCLQYESANPTQVVSAALTFDDIENVDDVARMVLKGGVFPNYPEQDGFDNDGDGGYIVLQDLDLSPPLDPVYIAGTLDRDMVDNDRNGYIDERGTPQDGDADDDFDYFGLGSGALGDGINQFLSEGVDEGFGVGAGEFLFGTRDLVFYNDRSQYPTDNDYAIFDSNTPVFALSENPVDGSTGIDAIAAGGLVSNPNGASAPYIGSNDDPADWKAFVERRWYPGDNVIVTLYDTTATEEFVVDRVTYREQDITNRTIDDIVPWAAVYGVGTELNVDYPTFWRPNHMGLDFYRSIERKHPLYNGDRFGTTNRWEATDGNYDDWADSLSFFEGELSSDPANPLLNIAGQAVDIRRRFPVAGPATNNLRLFGHAIWGSPLRMNIAARKSENPNDVESLIATTPPADVRQFPNSLDYFRTHEDGTFAAGDTPKNGIRTPGDNPPTNNTKSLPNQGWNHSRAMIANRPYQSPGDLMRVPHQVYLHDAVNTAGASGFLRDMTLLNYGLEGDSPLGASYIQDIALRGATLGQDTVDSAKSPNILSAAIGSMALESVVLTMGQAEFRPIRPVLASGDNTLISWTPNPSSSGPDDLLAPAAWAPVFLFDLLSDGPRANLDHFPNYPSYVNGFNANAEIPLNYLFNGSYLSTLGNFGGVNVYNNDLTDRWPLETRTAMYVSEYPGGGDRPEALYVWDSADGLENGEYVVYIGTFLPDMRQRIEDAALYSTGNAALGIPAKSSPELMSTLGTTTSIEHENGTILPVNPVTKSILVRDPTNSRRVTREFEPVYALEVITDPSEARGQAPASGVAPGTKPPGLVDPDDWNPPTRYTPGPDGYIFYGNNTTGGWKPQIVRVTDNFLAIRVRNMGDPGQVAVLTHVVLAPRKRSVGRVNVNTVQSRVVRTQLGDQNYYSTLLGLPGAVDVAQTIQPTNALNVLAPPILPATPIALRSAPMTIQNLLTGLHPWTPPERRVLSTIPTAFYDDTFRTPPSRNRFTGDLLNPDNDLLVDDGPFTNEEEHEIGAFRLNAMLMGGRTEHADGRYYTSVGALAADTSAFDFNYDASRADIPDLDGAYTEGVEDFAIYPLSNEANPAKRFDEVKARFSRMGNLVTTRSDVFEIIMTVETGYGVDANLDGFLNYRDPKEFVTRASTKATAVYERRAPSDTSDGAE